MIGEIIRLLVGTAAGFFATALLARFAMQSARAPFRNPLGQFVIAVTDWMLIPARRVIPSAWGYDSASVVLAVAWQLLKTVTLVLLFGFGIGPAKLATLLLLAIANTLEVGFYLMMGVVLISAVFSWVNPPAPLAHVFDAVARPWLQPFRRFIPPMGGIDLSPLALIVVIQIAQIVLGGVQGTLFSQLLAG